MHPQSAIMRSSLPLQDVSLNVAAGRRVPNALNDSLTKSSPSRASYAVRVRASKELPARDPVGLTSPLNITASPASRSTRNSPVPRKSADKSAGKSSGKPVTAASAAVTSPSQALQTPERRKRDSEAGTPQKPDSSTATNDSPALPVAQLPSPPATTTRISEGEKGASGSPRLRTPTKVRRTRILLLSAQPVMFTFFV